MLDKISGAVSTIKTTVTEKVDQAKAAVTEAVTPSPAAAPVGFSGVSSFGEAKPMAKAATAGLWADLFGSKEAVKPVVADAAKKALEQMKKNVQSDTPPALNPSGGTMIDAGDRGTPPTRVFDTGANQTTVRDGAFDSKVSMEETIAARAKTMGEQHAQVDRMSQKLGKPVSNPPTTEQAQEYFKTLAGKGTPAEVGEMKKEFGQYATNFYVHPGEKGGVRWGAKTDLVKDMDKAFADQPKLKDGRKVIDCEGYTALTEKMLGPIQDPKTKKPMFELQHIKSGSHTMVGVFQKGQPPFVVNNHTVTEVTPEQISATKDFLKQNKAPASDFDKPIGRQRLMERVFQDAGNEGATKSAPTYKETDAAWRKGAGLPVD